jgi:hypothetical protein
VGEAASESTAAVAKTPKETAYFCSAHHATTFQNSQTQNIFANHR